MSKGSTRLTVRLDDETIDLIQEECDRSEKSSDRVPYTVSSWIRHAVQEKLNKLRRGRGEETVMRAPLPDKEGLPVSHELEGSEEG